MVEWLGGARRHRGRARLRLPARPAARGARRQRVCGRAAQLRDRARAPRHRRGDPLRRRHARRAARAALPRPQRRRPHRPRPDRAAAAPTRQRGARATLALYPVEDASAYGLVRRDERGRRARVPREDRRARPRRDQRRRLRARSLGARPDPAGREVSIEREVFPRLVGDGLYGLPLDGYWMDIGTPDRYLQASWDILEGRVHTAVEADRSRHARRRRRRDRRRRRRSARGPWSLPAAGSPPGAEVRESVLLDGCERRRGCPGRAVRSSLRASVSPPERPWPTRSPVGMKESRPRSHDRRRPRHPRPAPRRPLAGRRRAPGGRRSGRAAGLRDGRLGDRRRPRRRGARRPPDAADADRPRLLRCRPG